jgi:hypothetical protein
MVNLKFQRKRSLTTHQNCLVKELTLLLRLIELLTCLKTLIRMSIVSIPSSLAKKSMPQHRFLERIQILNLIFASNILLSIAAKTSSSIWKMIHCVLNYSDIQIFRNPKSQITRRNLTTRKAQTIVDQQLMTHIRMEDHSRSKTILIRLLKRRINSIRILTSKNLIFQPIETQVN